MALLLSLTYLYTQADGIAGDITVDSDDQIILALIALIGTSIGGLVYVIKTFSLGKETAKDAKEANKAVNNIGPDQTRLYDMVARIEAKQDEFDRRWGNLPPEMDDAVGLAGVLTEIHRRQDEIQRKLDQLDTLIASLHPK